MPRRLRQLLILLLLLSLGNPRGLVAQRQKWHDGSFAYRREVQLAANTPPAAIVVTEFFSHGALPAGSAHVAVYGRKDPLACRLLQHGPGDFCRLAFQTDGKQKKYYVYYGGEGRGDVAQPQWTERAGLLLETRAWRPCDLNRLESVQAAFENSPPIGSSFVPQVFHRRNPFELHPAPFLSRYQGTLLAPVTGKYTFFTSSQDCSFLLIDGKRVVAAPGRHPPDRRARIRGDVVLNEGPHPFEYWHAASGAEACMVAAWQLPGLAKPSQISADVFGHDRIAHLLPTRLEGQREGLLPDFRLAVLGDAPVEESDQWLVRVHLTDATAFTPSAAVLWQFGDGQESKLRHPQHVYLHAGIYRVKLSMRRGDRKLEISHRVPVRRPAMSNGQKASEDTLAAYMPLLETYAPQTLDPPGLLQLVRAYIQLERFSDAVQAGRVAFQQDAAQHDDQSRWNLVQLIAPLALDQLDDAEAALQLWKAAGQLIGRRQWRAECAVAAADICLNDLLRRDQAQPFLQFASERLENGSQHARSRLYRIWGDWYARGGDGEAARQAYAKAAVQLGQVRNSIQRNAWRGAHSRSTEAFLREGQLARARQELRRWQADFPADKREGYLSLLLARYHVAQQKLPTAVAVANDLLTVNPASAYADQLLYLSATCEEQMGHPARAEAAYRSLLTDYPGSPLVKRVQQQLSRLTSGQPGDSDTSHPQLPQTGEAKVRKDPK